MTTVCNRLCKWWRINEFKLILFLHFVAVHKFDFQQFYQWVANFLRITKAIMTVIYALSCTNVGCETASIIHWLVEDMIEFRTCSFGGIGWYVSHLLLKLFHTLSTCFTTFLVLDPSDELGKMLQNSPHSCCSSEILKLTTGRGKASVCEVYTRWLAPGNTANIIWFMARRMSQVHLHKHTRMYARANINKAKDKPVM